MNSGAYQLLIYLSKKQIVTIGRFGDFEFPKGFYIYTGSALKNLDARVMRHFSPASEKKLRWHIDFLLAKAKVIGYKIHPSTRKEECKLNSITAKIPGSAFLFPGFGSSDCRKCISHLCYFKILPEELKKNFGNR